MILTNMRTYHPATPFVTVRPTLEAKPMMVILEPFLPRVKKERAKLNLYITVDAILVTYLKISRS